MILEGITVLEMVGQGPSQFCCKVLQDFGAKIIKIDKITKAPAFAEFLSHGKLSVALNLKSAEGLVILKQLCRKADVLIESFRYGVMEKLGLGPETLMGINQRLVYTRLSGFGQSSYKDKSGHDLNFLGLSGFLSLANDEIQLPFIGPFSDIAGGALNGVLGILLALLEREKSGQGQVVDVSMVRAATYYTSWMMDAKDMILKGPDDKGSHFDGSFYMYNIYKTKDGKRMSVAAVEPQFYDQLLIGLGLSHEECPYFCQNGYEILKKKFLEKTQSEWTQIFKNLDACVFPILGMDEAVRDRPDDFVNCFGNGEPLPLPEPRFSRIQHTPSCILAPPSQGQHTIPVLQALGYTYEQICHLDSEGIVYFPKTSKL